MPLAPPGAAAQGSRGPAPAGSRLETFPAPAGLRAEPSCAPGPKVAAPPVPRSNRRPTALLAGAIARGPPPFGSTGTGAERGAGPARPALPNARRSGAAGSSRRLSPRPGRGRRRRATALPAGAMDAEAAGDEQSRLRALFLACDANGSGRIEREDFAALCAELRVRPAEAEAIFQRLDSDRDGAITFREFARGFRGATRRRSSGGPGEQEPVEEDEEAAATWSTAGLEQPWRDFEVRLGDEARYIPR